MSGLGRRVFESIVIIFLLIVAFPVIASASMQKAPEGIDEGIWKKIAARIGESAYDFSASAGQPLAGQNRLQGFLLSSDKGGLLVRPRTKEKSADKSENREKWDLRMALWGHGRGEIIKEAPSVAPVYDKNKLKYLREGITEWYVNNRSGVEHGFTVHASPEGADSAPLTVVVAAETGLKPELLPGGKGVRFADSSGKALRYDNLHVYDATGKELKARFEDLKSVEGRHLVSLNIDDKDAQYPLTVDPLLYTEARKITASDGAASDLFGYSVAASGDIVVVGAQGDESSRGAAYVYYRNQGGKNLWGQVKKLTASDGVAGDRFGTSVAISGDMIVVGAERDSNGANTYQGSAYIYYRNEGAVDNWGEKKHLFASDGAAYDYFGRSVAISGDIIVVGADMDDVGANDEQGSVYIYYRNQGAVDNWGEKKHLFASDGAASDYFGRSVAISGDIVVIGAYYDDVSGISNQGSAYVFYRNLGGADLWGEKKHLFASDGAASDYFGCSVSISGDIVVIGAYYDDVSGTSNQGSAYVFYRNQGGADLWGETKKLVATGGAGSDYFGNSVSISGDTVLVGAYLDSVSANTNQGSAYVFTRNEGGGDNWGQVIQLLASDGAAYDRFGYAVAISGNNIVSGAYYDDVGANANQGSAYIFRSEENVWYEAARPEASDGAANDNFGVSVAKSGDIVVVGAVGDDSWRGSAYVFYRNQGGADMWGQVKKLTASDGAASDFFGRSVGISGDILVVGASEDDSDRGSAYVFYRNQGGADMWGQVRKLTASDGAASDLFGVSAAISGDIIVIGAYHDDIGVNADQGSAYVFYRNQGGADLWGQVKKLIASDGDQQDYFGISVAISGDKIVVGAYYAGSASAQGFAYVFYKNEGGVDNWGEKKKLVASDGADLDSFGSSVSIFGDVIAVGAEGDDSLFYMDDGSVYVYYRNQGGADNWGLVKKITASDAAQNDNFGGAVSLWEDTLVVGSFNSTTNSGAVYLFHKNNGIVNGWGESAIICSSDPIDPLDSLGSSVAISGNSFITGVPDAYGVRGLSAVFDAAYDIVSPTGTISIKDGAIGTNSLSVTLFLSCTDSSGCSEMQFSDGGGLWSDPEEYAAIKLWTLPSGNGTKTVFVRFKDTADNWSGEYSNSDTIIYDTIAPVTSASPAGGTYGAAQNVTLTCSDASGSGCTFTNYYTAAGGWREYGSPINISSSTTLRFYSIDHAQNVETEKTVVYTFDTTPPTGTIVINSAATYTNTLTVFLTLSCSDASGCDQMRISDDNVSWSTGPYGDAAQLDLDPGNGTKTVYVQFKDFFGNWSSATISDSIVLDTGNPAGTVSINNGAAYTNNPNVTLTLNCGDTNGCAEMCIKNDSSYCSVFETYAQTKDWGLSAGETGKIVYVTFRDSAGNIATFNDSITLDLTPPTGTISINSGAATTGSTSATLTLTCTDNGAGASGCSLMQLSDDGIDWDPAEGFSTSRVWTLPGSDDEKYVYVRFSDVAGNWSGPYDDFIVLDRTGPNDAIISLPDFTNSISLDFSVSCSDVSGCAKMQFSNDNTGWSTPEEDYGSAKSGWLLPPGDGQKSVYARFKDGVGNWSTFLITDTTFLDTTVPVTTASPAGGTYGAAQSVTLSCSDAGSGCFHNTYYCTGTDCTPSSAYSSPINISASTTLRFRSSDDALNTENIKTETYVIDASAPTGTIIINLGAAATNSTSVTLALTCTDANGCAQMKFSDDNVGWSVEEGYATTKSRTLISGDGTKTIYVKFKDTVNNWSGAYSDAILLDTAAPVTTASPAGGTYATAQNVTLSCSDTAGSGCSTRYYCTGEGCTPTTLYSSALNISSATTLRFYSIDGVNNTESVKTETYVIDASAPTGTISINSGAVSTNATAVMLALTCDDANGCSQMQFSDDNSLWSAAEDYATSKARTLPSGDGTKTVYVKFKDALGNWSGAYSDSIILDTTAPVTTASPAGGTHGSQQNVELTCNDGSGSGCVATYYCKGAECTPTTPVGSSVSISTTTTLRFYSRDGATNNETVRTETYVIDASAPTGTITINTGAAATASTSATLTLTCSDSNGCSHMKFSDDNVSWSVEEGYAPSKARTLPSGDGTKTVYVKFKDTLGNWSGAYSDTILLDQTAPVTTASPAGGSYSSAQSVTLSCSDGTGSGCNARYYCPGDTCAPTTLYSGALNISSTTTLRFYSKDAANNNESVKTEVYVIDASAPTGTIIINSGNAATASTSATLTLTCSDSNGCSHMKFSDNNVGWSVEEGYATGKARTLPSGDGTKTVYVKFKDTLGNWSGVYSDTILLDQTAPVTTATPAGGTYGSAQSVTLSCGDGTGSGCAGTYYCAGAACAPTTPYSGPINVASSTTLKFFSADSLTNSEVIKSEDYSIAFTLTVSKTGVGSGIVTVNTGDLQWAGDIGTANYYSETSVDITAEPEACSYFNGWTGACSGSESLCTLLMNSSRATSAAFNTHSLVVDNAPNYSASIQSGYDAALDGAVLKVRAITLTGDLLFDDAKQVKLAGGYDCGYSTNTGAHTTVNGKMTIGGAGNGGITVENITIR